MDNIVEKLKKMAADPDNGKSDIQRAFFEMMAGLAANPLTGQAGAEQAEDTRELSQALIVNFKYGLEKTDEFHAMDDALFEHFGEEGPMIYDGHEIAIDLSDGTLFFYGPDANELLKAATPLMQKFDFLIGAECVRRFGEADDEAAVETRSVLEAA
jgi:hypothetical protein